MKGKTPIIANFHRTDLVICSHSRERNTRSYSQINMVMSFFFQGNVGRDKFEGGSFLRLSAVQIDYCSAPDMKG